MGGLHSRLPQNRIPGIPNGSRERGTSRLDRYKEEMQDEKFKTLETTRRIQAIENYPHAPAIVMFHLKPREHYQSLRIDIPATSLGLVDNITSNKHLEFMDPSIVEHFVAQLVEDFGGRDVYNALLYVVDKEVRLSGKVVDTVYKGIIAEELGVQVEYDRASRRFTY